MRLQVTYSIKSKPWKAKAQNEIKERKQKEKILVLKANLYFNLFLCSLSVCAFEMLLLYIIDFKSTYWKKFLWKLFRIKACFLIRQKQNRPKNIFAFFFIQTKSTHKPIVLARIANLYSSFHLREIREKHVIFSNHRQLLRKLSLKSLSKYYEI